jgi:hypothetical protein
MPPILVSESIITKSPLLTHIFYLCVRSCMPAALNSLLKCRSSSHAVVQLVVVRTRRPRSASPSGGQKDGSQWVLNQNLREEEGEQSTPLPLLLPLCADRWVVWCHTGGRLDSSSYMTEPLKFVVAAALMLAYIALN